MALKSLQIFEKAFPLGGRGGAAAGGGGISAGPASLALASKYLLNQLGIGTPSGKLRFPDMPKNEKIEIQTRKQRKVLMAFGE